MLSGCQTLGGKESVRYPKPVVCMRSTKGDPLVPGNLQSWISSDRVYPELLQVGCSNLAIRILRKKWLQGVCMLYWKLGSSGSIRPRDCVEVCERACYISSTILFFSIPQKLGHANPND